MSLAIALNNALTGLNISQRSLAVLSQNIANANTQGYSRQILNQQAVYLDGAGAGVSISDITRKVDDYLLRAVRTQNASVGKTNVQADYVDRIQLLLGRPASQNNISSDITSFFNNLQSLGITPESTTQRVNVINSAAQMTQHLASLADGLQELRYQADQDITRAIDTVNHDIQDLFNLNTNINSSLALGKSVAGLFDQRDALLRDITQYLDVQTVTRDNGTVNIFTNGGYSLLDDSPHRLIYNPAASASVFSNRVPLSPIQLQTLDADGNVVPTQTVTLVTSDISENVSTVLTSGKIKGWLELRDHQIPAILDQLDNYAANLRDEINALHNAGSGFPGDDSYTGTRAVFADDFSQWAGSFRIAVLNQNGQPVTSSYADETSGLRPLTLDLSQLDTGNGEGQPSVEGIINEINNYLGSAGNRVTLGNLNNIRMVSDVNSIPGTLGQFSFDFDLENISATNADFFVTGVQVLDSTNTDITQLSSTLPSIAIDPSNSFITSPGSSIVTVNTTAAHGLANGDRIYLSNPGTVDNIPGTNFNQFFTITNVTSTSFQIDTGAPALTGGTYGVVGQTITPPYDTVAAGDYSRTKDNGLLTLDLSDNLSSPYYTIRVNVAVDDGNGNLSTSTLTYRVDSPQVQLLNDRFSATAATGDGTIVAPSSTTPAAIAMLVDANGHELPKSNGRYTTSQAGYLKIVAGNSSNVIAIDSLDSAEQGKPNSNPPVTGTNRGFSHYFELNNFFEALTPDSTGGTVHNSAANLRVMQRLLDDPNLISLGTLTQSAPPADTSLAPYYTYERHVGDNSIIQRMAGLAVTSISFAAAGGQGASQQTFTSYAGQIIGAASANAASAKNEADNAQVLMDGYTQRADAISGVNLDEELANTIIYQNAYSASARVITVASDLFKLLLESF